MRCPGAARRPALYLPGQCLEHRGSSGPILALQVTAVTVAYEVTVTVVTVVAEVAAARHGGHGSLSGADALQVTVRDSETCEMWAQVELISIRILGVFSESGTTD